MAKRRIMYLLTSYPQLSQTYVNVEINAVKDDYDLAVLATHSGDFEDDRPLPYRILNETNAIVEAVREFKPHVLHSHHLLNVELVSAVAHATNTPFTFRGHSFDAMQQRYVNERSNAIRALRGGNIRPLFRWALNRHVPSHLQRPALFNDDLCLGILAFPYTRPFLEKSGIRQDKLIDCYPVIDYQMFYNEGPNGDGVMNVGACMPKKQMEDFVYLGKRMSGTHFDLYPIGHITEQIRQINLAEGEPVIIHEPEQHRFMPSIYKAHRWLCYTASRHYGTVGWPIAVAEAQAAGVGVLMPNLRPDIQDFLGGAGYVYNTLDEAKKILSQPLPDEIRSRGFEQAKLSDIQKHKHLLTDLWDSIPL